MTHKIQYDGAGNLFGYIMADESNSAACYTIRTHDGVVDPTDAQRDLTLSFYEFMVASFTTPPVPINIYYRYDMQDPIPPVSVFYQVGDVDGTPTSTRLPTEIRPFVRVTSDSGTPFDLTITASRSDGTLTYDGTSHICPVGESEPLGTDLRPDAGFVADLLGANPLRVAVSADGPADSYWRLYAVGFRYPVVSKIPPLRQYPRDDGLATSSVTRGARAASRQVSIRRGPRGTYY